MREGSHVNLSIAGNLNLILLAAEWSNPESSSRLGEIPVEARSRSASFVDPSPHLSCGVSVEARPPSVSTLTGGGFFHFKRWMEKSMLDPNEDPTTETEAQEESKDGSETPTEALPSGE